MLSGVAKSLTGSVERKKNQKTIREAMNEYLLYMLVEKGNKSRSVDQTRPCGRSPVRSWRRASGVEHPGTRNDEGSRN